MSFHTFIHVPPRKLIQLSVSTPSSVQPFHSLAHPSLDTFFPAIPSTLVLSFALAHMDCWKTPPPALVLTCTRYIHLQPSFKESNRTVFLCSPCLQRPASVSSGGVLSENSLFSSSLHCLSFSQCCHQSPRCSSKSLEPSRDSLLLNSPNPHLYGKTLGHLHSTS